MWVVVEHVPVMQSSLSAKHNFFLTLSFWLMPDMCCFSSKDNQVHGGKSNGIASFYWMGLGTEVRPSLFGRAYTVCAVFLQMFTNSPAALWGYQLVGDSMLTRLAVQTSGLPHRAIGERLTRLAALL